MPYVLFLLGERSYDPKRFHYRVRRIMIDDHNVPTLEWVLCHIVCRKRANYLGLDVLEKYYFGNNFIEWKTLVFETREMLLFSKEVNEWMAQDPENVVAIHCKGGKGNAPVFFHFPFC